MKLCYLTCVHIIVVLDIYMYNFLFLDILLTTPLVFRSYLQVLHAALSAGQRAKMLSVVGSRVCGYPPCLSRLHSTPTLSRGKRCAFLKKTV